MTQYMKKFHAWLRLMRPSHWVKNVLVIFPLFFSGRLFDVSSIATAFVGFLAFNFLASFVYIFNDLNDVEKDRRHPSKRNRPIASGIIPIHVAVIGSSGVLFAAFALAVGASLISGNYVSLISFALYLIVNLLYSKCLKNVPIIDVVCIAAGFILRVFYGGAVINVPISDWLFLTVASASFFLGFGKRRNELRRSGTSSRPVLAAYSQEFLTPILYVFLGLTVTFYSLWAINSPWGSTLKKYTIIIVMVIVSEYCRIIEGNSDGDPAEVLLRSRVLQVIVFVFALLLAFAIYMPY